MRWREPCSPRPPGSPVAGRRPAWEAEQWSHVLWALLSYDAAGLQAWAGPRSQEEGAGARHPPVGHPGELGWDSLPGQGTPTQRVVELGPARQRTIGRGPRLLLPAGGFPTLSTSALRQAGSGVPPVPIQCGPSPLAAVGQVSCDMARLRHD